MTYKITRMPMAKFYIPEGMYSIDELEELLALMKKTKERQDKLLTQAMRPVEGACEL